MKLGTVRDRIDRIIKAGEENFLTMYQFNTILRAIKEIWALYETNPDKYDNSKDLVELAPCESSPLVVLDHLIKLSFSSMRYARSTWIYGASN